MLVSVITVVYNEVDKIEETIKSVIPFVGKNVEYIIIDGGSTDGTVELIEKYKNQLEYWLSEKDNGIYDALNKGLNKCNGKYILTVNIGDKLKEIPTDILQECINQDIDIVSFSVLLDSKTVFKPEFNYKLKYNNTLHHQGTFYKMNKFLHYNTSYKVFADFDLNQNLYKNKCKFKIFAKIISEHSTQGISHSEKSIIKELFRIVNNNFGFFWLIVSNIYFRIEGRKAWIKRQLGF